MDHLIILIVLLSKGSKAAGLGYINDTLMRRVWDEAFTLYGLIAEYR